MNNKLRYHTMCKKAENSTRNWSRTRGRIRKNTDADVHYNRIRNATKFSELENSRGCGLWNVSFILELLQIQTSHFLCSVPGSRATVKARLRSLRSWSVRHSGARSSSMQRTPTINFQPTLMWTPNSGNIRPLLLM
jgi:hypothetical protein